MQGLNRVELLGTVAAEPELRETTNGLPMLSVLVATAVRYCDRAGAWVDKTDEHELCVFGARAESLAKMLRWGAPVFVEGSLTGKPYTDRNGQQRRAMSLSVANVILVDAGNRESKASVQGGIDDIPFG